MPKTTTATATAAASAPATVAMPYSPGGSPWSSDKPTARTRGFLVKYIDLGLLLPTAVADALATHNRIVAWAGAPRPDADHARHQYRQSLAEAAATGSQPPDPAPVVAALTRADAAATLARDIAAVSEQAHANLMRAVTLDTHAMVGHLHAEHDRLMAEARDHAAALPATVTTGEAAAVHSEAAATAWRQLDQIGHRILAVRNCRVKAAALDPTRGALDYALFQRPDAFPRDAAAPVGQPAAAAALDLIHDRHGAHPWCPTIDELAAHVETERADKARRRQGPEAARGRYVAPPTWNQP